MERLPSMATAGLTGFEWQAMLIRIAGIEPESLVDGPGVRYVIFTQGCERGCPGCHNPSAQPMEGGQLIATAELAARILTCSHLDGVTFSGGEPFLQAVECADIAGMLIPHGLHIAAYSGYRLEELLQEPHPGSRALLAKLDWLADGPFLQQERDLAFPFRGSRNQKLWQRNQIQCMLDSTGTRSRQS